MARRKDCYFEMKIGFPYRAFPGEEMKAHDEIARKIKTLIETCFDLKLGALRDCQTGRYRKLQE